MQSIIALAPTGEERFDRSRHRGKCRKVPIVSDQSASQFPNSFDGIQFGTVGRKVFEDKARLGLESPFLVEPCVVVLRVVQDDDHPSAGMATDAAQALEEGKERFPIEGAFFALPDELAVAQPDGAEVANALAPRKVQQDRVFRLGSYPRSASRSVLLIVNFVQRPNVKSGIPSHFKEFFYMRPALQRPLWRVEGGACAIGIQANGTVADTAAHSN